MKITIDSACSFKQIGRRSYQQDARYPDTDTPDSGERVYLVCDGVGGSQHGEVASNAFCTHMADALKRFDLRKPLSIEQLQLALYNAMEAFYATLRQEAPDSATTVTMAVVHGGGMMLAHAGDSRIYHIRPDVGILYRSNDDSLVNALVHSGNLTPEQAIDHPRSNVITRCMALDPTEPPVLTAVNITDVRPGDQLLLCTDGVLHCLTDAQLTVLLSSPLSTEEKVQTLAEASVDSSDNNTAILLSIGAVKPLKRRPALDVASVIQPLESLPSRSLFSRLFGRHK